MTWLLGNTGWLIPIAFGILAAAFTAAPKLRTRMTRIDRRVAAILVAIFLALAATGYALANNYWHVLGGCFCRMGGKMFFFEKKNQKTFVS